MNRQFNGFFTHRHIDLSPIASKDGIEISYKTGFGIIKIKVSPEQKALFLSELKNRCKMQDSFSWFGGKVRRH